MRQVLRVGFAVTCLGLAAGDAAARLRVGEEIVERIESQHPYGAGPAAEPVLARTVRHAAATYIALHFERFALADGDYLIVRSPDGSQSWRYEGLGRAGLGLSPEGFWATFIRGDSAIVELYAPSGGAWGFAIDRYARGYTEPEMLERGAAGDPQDIEAICGTDDSQWAKCYQTSEPEIYDQSRAVSRLLIQGSFSCTGWLVGCEGHVMTNNHCIASQSDASNTDYEFMAEGATCSTNCFGFGCPGPIEATSATLVKTNVALDYTLVKLPVNVTPTYGFMTLRDSGALLNERIYVPQHPAGWGKRIAVFSTHAQDQSGFCEVSSLNAPPCIGGPGDIGYFADTQGGSSGSPVLAYSDHKVVSLHHCANCPNRGLDIVDVIGNLGTSLPACATANLVGSVVLDDDRYACSDTTAITVEDDSLQGETSHAVTIDSPAEPAGESVVLTPVPAGSGNFVGTIQLTAAAASGGDGKLSVGDGQTITVLYIDEDDGLGGVDVPRTATADVDCIAPLISNVQATNVGGATATIGWTTNEPSTSRVTYGVTPPGSTSVENLALVTSHSLGLTGLLQCREYFFWVSSADDVGNLAADDNGGAYYSFETSCTPPPPVPDGSGASSPLTVERVNASGTQLKLYWDNGCVTPPATAKILYGPLDQVASYALGGAVCSIPRLATPKTWSPVPAGDLWFVMSGDNGFGHESSWGVDSGGQERNGPTASGLCGSSVKNLGSSCP